MAAAADAAATLASISDSRYGGGSLLKPVTAGCMSTIHTATSENGSEASSISAASTLSEPGDDCFVFEDDEDPVTVNVGASTSSTIDYLDDLVDGDDHDDSWQWPVICTDPALCRDAREAATALLAQLLSGSLGYTYDSFAGSANFTGPHSTAGSTPTYHYTLGLQPVKLLLNVGNVCGARVSPADSSCKQDAAPATPVSTPILKGMLAMGLEDDDDIEPAHLPEVAYKVSADCSNMSVYISNRCFVCSRPRYFYDCNSTAPSVYIPHVAIQHPALAIVSLCNVQGLCPATKNSQHCFARPCLCTTTISSIYTD